MKLKFAFLLILLFQLGFSQVGSINLNVFNDFTKKPVSATVIISGTKTTFSGEGNIMIKDLPSGNYSFEISSAGFETSFLNDITIVPNQNLTFSVGLFQKAANIQEVIIEKKHLKPP